MQTVHVVYREEHHILETCPCPECVRERRRRERAQKATSAAPCRDLSPDAAHALGIIKHRCPTGSLASEIRQRG